jgi:N-terminal domain of anti-restriction factor ArdC
MKAERFDIHQHITDQILAAIERGAGEFRLPWHRSAGNIMRPVNVASKKPCRGVNILTLWATADEKGYTSGLFGTYRQWAEAGAQVRKGEKAAYIVFYKEITVASDEAESDECETRLFARATPVFAAEQVDGYASPPPDTTATVSSRRSTRPRLSSPRPATSSITAATAPSIAPRRTAFIYRRARLSSAPPPAQPPSPITLDLASRIDPFHEPRDALQSPTPQALLR